MKLERIIKGTMALAMTGSLNAAHTIYKDIEGYYGILANNGSSVEDKGKYIELTNRCFVYGSKGFLSPKNMRETYCDGREFRKVVFKSLEYKGPPHIPVQDQVPTRRPFLHAPIKHNQYVQPETPIKKVKKEPNVLLNSPFWFFTNATQVLTAPMKLLMGEGLFQIKK